MKCTECPDYHECNKANDLRRKRGKCKKAKEPLVQTNAEHIRTMTNEELKRFLCDVCDCSTCRWGTLWGCALMEWLEQPAEVGNEE